MKNPPCLHIGSPYHGGECPEMVWDKRLETGCPAWREYTQENPKGSGNMVLLKKGCCFQLQEFWQFETVKLLESNYSITETLNNGICTVGPDGKSMPKSSAAEVVIAKALEEIVERIDLVLKLRENILIFNDKKMISDD